MCNRKCVDASMQLRPIEIFCGDEKRSTAVISQLVSTNDSSFEISVGNERGGDVSDVVPQLHRTSHTPCRKFCCCISSACNQLQCQTEFQEIQALGWTNVYDSLWIKYAELKWTLSGKFTGHTLHVHSHAINIPTWNCPQVLYPCLSFRKTQCSTSCTASFNTHKQMYGHS